MAPGSFYQSTAHSFVPEKVIVGSAERDAWIRMALQFIRVRKAEAKRGDAAPNFTAEDLAIEMRIRLYANPPDDRSWGLVMQRAKAEQMIVETDEKRLTRAGHRSQVWRHA